MDSSFILINLYVLVLICRVLKLIFPNPLFSLTWKSASKDWDPAFFWKTNFDHSISFESRLLAHPESKLEDEPAFLC
uniref:Ig-like domain-containing protein n=1 Tax=Solanum lycopersicum TaxID=4081 RepID=A0A3Q7EQV1_SOLLC